jgi:hypothetical protein
VKLQNRSLIRYLGKKIRLCRHDPISQPKVQLGILTYESSPLSSSPSSLRSSSSRLRLRPRRRQQEEQHEQHEQQLRRGSWMRQRFSFGDGGNSNHRIRQSITMLRDEFEMMDDNDYYDDDSDDDDENENENENIQEDQHEHKQHPFVGQIGTIATVQYTHERTTIVNSRGNNNNISNNSNSNSNYDDVDVDDDSLSLWKRYEDMDEIVFTAIGTSRFRILSCVNDDDNDCKIFKVVELNDEPLPRPPFSTRPLPFRTQQYQRRRKRSRERSSDEECSYNDEEEEDEKEKEEESTAFVTTVVDNTNKRSIQRQTERMARNLSQLTAVPFFVYRHFLPWSIVEKIVMKLNSNDGRGNLPSLGKDGIISNRTNNLERTFLSIQIKNHTDCFIEKFCFV